MIVADTSVWIRFLRGHAVIRPVLQSAMESGFVIAVGCVFGELLQGTRNEEERHSLCGYWENLPQKDESGLWIDAGVLSARGGYVRKGVGLIDAYIIAFAKRHALKVWSLDLKMLSVLSSGEIYAPT